MRVHALSDVHVDYDVNARWAASLSSWDYREDVLILAGDVSDSVARLRTCLETLAGRFRAVLFVPGNHELWVTRDRPVGSSLEKFEQVRSLVKDSGGLMEPWYGGSLAIVPLLAWYDFSFGAPSAHFESIWMDFRACRWPSGYGMADVTRHFLDLNPSVLAQPAGKVISFSHFLPRLDIMPHYIPQRFRAVYPVLGSAALDRQVRALRSTQHVYGHSHVNRRVRLDGVEYINNAFGYPSETNIAAKRLLCIHEE